MNEKIEMNVKKFQISEFCDVMINGELTIVCNIGNGQSLKIPSECWGIIETYIQNYTIKEICDAMSPEDQQYMNDIFDLLIKKEILIDYEENKTDSIDLAITNRCNLTCKHCCASALPCDGSDPLSTADIKKIINNITSINPRNIIVTGGEPMLRNDFFEISHYLKDKFQGNTNLMSNGLLITEENVDELISLYNGFNISIDGYDEETCSKIRGKGVFDKVMRAVKLLIEHGVNSKHIALSMVETAYTAGKTELFDELNDRLGTLSVVRVFSPIGRGRVNQKLLEIVDDKADDKSVNIKEDLVCQSCSAGRRRFAINHEGNICPCMLLDNEQYCMGNILEINDFVEFWNDRKTRQTNGYKNLQKIMPQYMERCKECNVRAFCVHCYPDFANALKLDEFDKLCQNRKSGLQCVWEV